MLIFTKVKNTVFLFLLTLFLLFLSFRVDGEIEGWVELKYNLVFSIEILSR